MGDFFLNFSAVGGLLAQVNILTEWVSLQVIFRVYC